MRKFTVIGLTGPTGSGKSTVSRFFEENGFVIINADEIARESVAKGSSCLKQLCTVFGNDILAPGGSLNRRLLAQRAFSSEENTRLLNDITHPWIFLRVMKICRENIDSGNNKILFDAPVLFESNSDIMCDCTVSVIAPRKIRAERIKKRDGLSEEEVKKRMSAQKEDDYYVNRSDHVIDGSLTLDEIKLKVREITDKFL